MFRQLDQRHSDQLTVTLEWDPDSGDVWVRCEDHRRPEESFTFWVEPHKARHAFLHPFAARPVALDPARMSAEEVGRSEPARRKLRLRRSTRRIAGTSAEPADADPWPWYLMP
jgi:hypothetical protein